MQNHIFEKGSFDSRMLRGNSIDKNESGIADEPLSCQQEIFDLL